MNTTPTTTNAGRLNPDALVEHKRKLCKRRDELSRKHELSEKLYSDEEWTPEDEEEERSSALTSGG